MTDMPRPEPTPVEIRPQLIVPRRPVGRIAAAVVGVVALIAAGAFAVNALAAEDNGPEDPVRGLLEAAAKGDVIGMLEELAPGEREALREPLEALVGELERLGILDDVDLDGLDAYELEVSDIELESELVGDDLAYVQVRSATAAYTFDPADLPLGPFLVNLLGLGLFGSEPATGTEEMGDPDGPIEDGIVTIERGGRWYVSIGHTIAEGARRAAGVALDQMGEGVEPDGAASAEEAVEAMVVAVAQFDLRRVLSLLPPGEMGALQEYAELFLADLESEISEAGGEVEITIDTLELTSDVDGDRASVKVDKLEMTIVADGATYRVVDGCVLYEEPGRAAERACLDDPESLGGFLGMTGFGVSGDLDVDTPPAGGELPDVAITVVRVDGGWYVSPIRTALDSMVASLATLEPEDLETFAATVMSGLAGSFGSMTGPGQGGWQAYRPGVS